MTRWYPQQNSLYEVKFACSLLSLDCKKGTARYSRQAFLYIPTPTTILRDSFYFRLEIGVERMTRASIAILQQFKLSIFHFFVRFESYETGAKGFVILQERSQDRQSFKSLPHFSGSEGPSHFLNPDDQL